MALLAGAEDFERADKGREFPDMGVNDVQLVLAIEQHNVVGIRELLLKVSNVDLQTKQRRTALYAAVQHNNIVAARMLLEHGASMNVLPMNKSEQAIGECPMLLAFRMGESHQEMQLLFLRKLKDIRPTWLSATDQQIIAMIPKYAMQYATPLVFFEAIGESGGANMCKDGEISSLSPLMHTLQEIALFGTDPAKCAKTMENVFEMLDKYPAMVWERLKAPVNVPRLDLVYAEGSTALGMLVFGSLPARLEVIMEIEEMGENFLKFQQTMQAAMSDNNPIIIVEPLKVEADKQRSVAFVTYMTAKLIPNIFARMLCAMQVALAMATHFRLGENEACCAKWLDKDVIKTIFNVLARTIMKSPAVVKEFLC